VKISQITDVGLHSEDSIMQEPIITVYSTISYKL